MDTDVVRIERISGGPTAQAYLHQFVIDTVLVANPTRSLQLQTVNSFAASLCQRALDTHRPIAVTWEHTKYGNTLRTAFFLKCEVKA